MALANKFGVLLLAAVGVWAVTEFDLIGSTPRETTGAALRQFQNSDVAAEQVRETDAAKNAWLLLGPGLLVLLTLLLFWNEVAQRLVGESDPGT